MSHACATCGPPCYADRNPQGLPLTGVDLQVIARTWCPLRRTSTLAAMTRRHLERRARIADLLDQQAGVASRYQLRTRGIDRFAVRCEVDAGRWHLWGGQTLAIDVSDRTAATRWSGLFEVGAGARLEGVTALQQAGLSGWKNAAIEVAVPRGKHHVPRNGIRTFTVTRLEDPIAVGIPRSPVVPAALRAAQRARSDAQAATLLAMTVQQRLLTPVALLTAWRALPRARRRKTLDPIFNALCDGAQALDELNFAALCGRYGLPAPEQQAVLEGPRGRIYRDARWPGLTVEIDGAQHWEGLATVDDALRANVVSMAGDTVLRIPALGLRLREAEFMQQVVVAYHGTSHP